MTLKKYGNTSSGSSLIDIMKHVITLAVPGIVLVKANQRCDDNMNHNRRKKRNKLFLDT